MRILKSAQKMHVLSVIYNIYGLASISIMFRSALLWAIYHIKSKKKKKQHLRHVSCLEQQHICLDSLAKFWQSNYKRKIKLFKMEEVKCVKIQRSQCAKKCVVISKILACDQCVVVMAKGDNSSFFSSKDEEAMEPHWVVTTVHCGLILFWNLIWNLLLFQYWKFLKQTSFPPFWIISFSFYGSKHET